MKTNRRTAAALAIVVSVLFAGTGADAQKFSPADLATKLTGTWVLNRELSTGFRAPGRRGGVPAPRLRAVDTGRRFGAQAGVLFAMAAAAPQRGGGRGGGGAGDASDLTPAQLAEQAAMRQLQQITDQIMIKASAESVTFVDPRGERTYAINDKSVKVDVGGSPVSVKSKWDKATLKQEFSNTQAKLVETWSVDESGRLILTMKLESMTLITPEQKAVFDRK